ncbi:MAG: hypothetical protein EKK35_17860 [Bradyrhizobiaceae bacterium]|nr:MAG: hypothetical protein EKK35_17860 [Bradyrhizobiaceae bacterium]
MVQSQYDFCEIRSFSERDIDIWLAEELRNSGVFAQWFVDQIGEMAEATFPSKSVQVSVAAEDGETDVQALFDLVDGGTLAVLVENKIEHAITADQIRRYENRARHGIVERRWQQSRIVIFAPTGKIEQYRDIIGNTSTISFEAAGAFLRDIAPDQRSLYRAEFILRASEKWPIEANGADQFRVKFWDSLYQMVDRNFDGYFALGPKRYPKTTFISVYSSGVKKPRYCRLDLKGHMGEVDLAFDSVKLAELTAFLQTTKPANAVIALNKGSVALRIKGLDKFTVAEGFTSAESKASEAFKAARTLLTFCNSHRSFLDAHYSSKD